MNEVYTKRGATRRVVITRGSPVEITISECGRAVSATDHFEARPIEAEPLALDVDPAFDRTIGNILEITIHHQLDLRRLTAIEGISEHAIEPESKRWTEHHARVALRLENRVSRSGVDLLLGAASSGELKTASVERAAIALNRFRGDELEPARLGLSPNVTAELWTHLAGRTTRTLSLGQGVHSQFPFDGSGDRIEPFDAPANRWPNTYRPSYRYPAVAMPLHLSARGNRAARTAQWTAVAVLDRFRSEGTQPGMLLTCALLATDGRSSAAVRLAMSPGTWMEQLHLVESESEWFPHGGGSWGCDAEIELQTG